MQLPERRHLQPQSRCEHAWAKPGRRLRVRLPDVHRLHEEGGHDVRSRHDLDRPRQAPKIRSQDLVLRIVLGALSGEGGGAEEDEEDAT